MLLASESLQPIENPLLRMALLLVNGREGARLARGRKGGRPKALTPDKIVKAKAMLRDPTISVAAIAEMLGVSRATIYPYLPEAHASAARVLNAISPMSHQRATRVASMMFSARVNFVAWRMAALKDRFILPVAAALANISLWRANQPMGKIARGIRDRHGRRQRRANAGRRRGQSLTIRR